MGDDLTKLVQQALALEERLRNTKQLLQSAFESLLVALGSTGNTVEIPGKGFYTIMCRKGLYYWRPKPLGVYGLGGDGAKKARKTPVKPKSR